ncbi:MAG: GH92 family glycosyl hydrolase [Draconibacterium sp.]
MKATVFYIIFIVFTLNSAVLKAQITEQKSLCDYVNPLIGTDKMGHTFPGAVVPFGMVQLSPQSDTIPHNIDGIYVPDVYKYCAGYQYTDKTIVGFAHTAFSGTGHSDLGDFLVMPTVGKLRLNPGTADQPETGYRSSFDHASEVASPGYYKVKLDDYNVTAELTATAHVGIHKYTFPKTDDAHIIFDLNYGIYNYDGKVLWASARVENDTLVTGYRIVNGWARTRYIYFAMSFSKPIKNYGYKDFEKIKYNGFWRKFDVNHNFPEMAGRKIVSYFDFDVSNGEPVEIKVSLSAVSTEGALKNLHAEAPGWDFETMRTKARANWEKELSKITVQGDEDKMSSFYTSMYHAFLDPIVYNDVDGKYRGLDQNIHEADGFTNYTVFSLWDTYRALHPFFTLIQPKRAGDMVTSMLKHYEQSAEHVLPVWSHYSNENWCMIGYHAVSVISDAAAKGLSFDKDLALKAMISSSTLDYYGGLADYKKLGYVPVDVDGSGASMTLEYAYDDFAIGAFAQSIGKTGVANEYFKRAENYKKLFDPALQFVRPKYKNGSWKENFDILDTHGQGFIEGNSWNYSFYVPQDVNGLITEMGGDKKFIGRLDSLFTMHLPAKYFENTEDITEEGMIGNYVHGNEPSHHVPYLYAWTSEPWKSQYWIREIMDTKYLNKIDGLCGNDDCGQMSAWYILSSMGFYPVCPGTDQYVIGAPYFDTIDVNFDSGKTLRIVAKKLSDKNMYVQSVSLNGKPLEKAYITHKQITDGGTLEFVMGPKPNKKRVFGTDNLPFSLSTK